MCTKSHKLAIVSAERKEKIIVLLHIHPRFELVLVSSIRFYNLYNPVEKSIALLNFYQRDVQKKKRKKERKKKAEGQ